jgi:hypothetical protein
LILYQTTPLTKPGGGLLPSRQKCWPTKLIIGEFSTLMDSNCSATTSLQRKKDMLANRYW